MARCQPVACRLTCASAVICCPAQGIKYVWVDDPNGMENDIISAIPNASVKMDVGHIIFSRLGPMLDKKHEKYRECPTWQRNAHVFYRIDNCLRI